MRLRNLLIIDGYTDEPSGLGVPPYIDVYPREAYGALKIADKANRAYYMTIDQVRNNVEAYVELTKKVDLVLVIAGALVPGKYLAGEPLRDPKEFERLKALSQAPVALAGPAARFGLGGEGGSRAKVVEADFKVRGRLAHWVYTAATEGLERAEDVMYVDDYSLIDRALIKGSEVVKYHPNFSMGNLVAELETFSGCARGIVGGCSFCLTHLSGRPLVRDPISISKEVEALYLHGVRSFRLGRQSDILVYGSPDLGKEEWPKPSPEALERLFRGIRSKAPSLITLHIDNVNPGTVARWPKESKKALKVIVSYNTPGDVAAMGIESVDPKVIKMNNLKVDMEDAIKAVEIVNEVGARRGWNGLPLLLPGLNFIAGLPGESKETWRLNKEFLEEIERRGLLVRRLNVRKLSILPGTRVAEMVRRVRTAKGYESFRRFALKWQERMLKKIIPKGTVLRNVIIEKVERGISYGRQPGSYPITVEIVGKIKVGTWLSVRVKRQHARSVLAEPYGGQKASL